MDFSFTDTQDQLSALVRQILERDLTEERMREVEAGEDRFDPGLYTTLASSDVLGVSLPTSVGGGGYGLIEQCRVLVELGRAVAPVPVLASIVMGAAAVAEFGSDDQRQAWAAPAAAGRKILSVALVEDGATDPADPVTRADPSDDGWVIHGSKTRVPAGPIADVILVPAATPQGVSVFAVDPSDVGVRLDRQEVSDGEPEAALTLDGARLGGDRVVGGPGTGAEIVRWVERRATVGLCALQLGVCERALELTAAYAQERVQFDRPIATFQAVGQRLADAYIDVRGIELTLWQAAWRLAEGLDADTEIHTAKFWAADAGHRIAHTAVHVHGGIGIDLDYHLHRYFVAAKRIEFSLGGATEQLVAIGRVMADDPA